MKLETRTTEITVLPEGESLFHEQAMTIRIDDEAAGEFITIRQDHVNVIPGQIQIDPDEWPYIRDAIEKMMAECRKP